METLSYVLPFKNDNEGRVFLHMKQLKLILHEKMQPCIYDREDFKCFFFTFIKKYRYYPKAEMWIAPLLVPMLIHSKEIALEWPFCIDALWLCLKYARDHFFEVYSNYRKKEIITEAHLNELANIVNKFNDDNAILLKDFFYQIKNIEKCIFKSTEIDLKSGEKKGPYKMKSGTAMNHEKQYDHLLPNEEELNFKENTLSDTIRALKNMNYIDDDIEEKSMDMEDMDNWTSKSSVPQKYHNLILLILENEDLFARSSRKDPQRIAIEKDFEMSAEQIEGFRIMFKRCKFCDRILKEFEFDKAWNR